jgi:hypothetical protein
VHSGQVSQVEEEPRSLGGFRARSTRTPTIAAISLQPTAPLHSEANPVRGVFGPDVDTESGRDCDPGKEGRFLSGIIAADRALSILVSGDSNDFTIRIGIGKWLEHLGVAALETLLLSELFLVVDVAEMAWSLEVENKLAKQTESLVG